MFGRLITKVFGSKYERDIKRIQPIVSEINRNYEAYHDLSDGALRGKTDEFRMRIEARTGGLNVQLEELTRALKESPAEEHERIEADLHEVEGELRREEAAILDELLPEVYAAVKEVCRRLVGRSWDVCGQRITWEMIPFDVQLIGAIVLHQGKIAEMATGEGKTLAATMPLCLNALTGRGVHLITVNGYLARRDASWMGPVYDSLGLSVGIIQDRINNPNAFRLVRDGDDYRLDGVQRKEAYSSDIVYGTKDLFGFDYLYDNMATDLDDLVQRGYSYAIVDEADSNLIDEARVPLIISGPVPESSNEYDNQKQHVEKLVRAQTRLVSDIVAEAEQLFEHEGDHEDEIGVLLLQAQRGDPKHKRLEKMLREEGMKRLVSRVELDYLRDKRMGEIDEDLYYSVDERGHVVDLMEKGRQLLSPHDPDLFVIPDIADELSKIDGDSTLSDEGKVAKREEVYREYARRSEIVHSINQLLKAYSLFEKDVDYVVQDGKVVIVDQFTGRLQPGRRFSEGIHQSLEAKEGVKIEQETQTVATITFQNYFRLYEKLAGMTGTAETEAAELYEIYKLDVDVIPTNEPVRRVDYDDMIYRTRREKYNALIDEIARLHSKNLPVLVGTISVEVSETLSRMLKRREITHAVLNAKYHQQEAEIVAKAGQPGAVTIATNMAGRGTDIKLGGSVVKCQKCFIHSGYSPSTPTAEELTLADCLREVPCGLQVIGTERHEARRIDRQLRGRSGRQGDPGASRFFLSLEDDLMRLFGSDRIASIMDRLGVEEGEVIQHKLVTRSIERAQKKVEARNFEMRKHLLEYDDVMNQQREVVYDRRRDALERDDISDQVREAISEVVDGLIETYTDEKTDPEEWNLEGLQGELRDIFLIGFTPPERE
ncbi:MAG: preprotein translocase subunit SecA, partial [Candidatus Latescibacteria bacterium]|nr:preprotein translocase subunit SecA [Candidatus Latescibacterota bacterium]